MHIHSPHHLSLAAFHSGTKSYTRVGVHGFNVTKHLSFVAADRNADADEMQLEFHRLYRYWLLIGKQEAPCVGFPSQTWSSLLIRLGGLLNKSLNTLPAPNLWRRGIFWQPDRDDGWWVSGEE